MRISRGRLHLRVALLLVGGAWMAWRALVAWRAAAEQAGAGQLLAQRVALVMGLVALLALLTAAVLAWSLRPRARRHSLHLTGGAPTDGRPERASPPSGGPSAGPGAPT